MIWVSVLVEVMEQVKKLRERIERLEDGDRVAAPPPDHGQWSRCGALKEFIGDKYTCDLPSGHVGTHAAVKDCAELRWW